MKSRYLVVMVLLLTLLLATTGCDTAKGAVGGRQAQQAGGPSAEEVEKAKKNLAAAEGKVKTAEEGKKTAEADREAKQQELDQANAKLAEAQVTVQTLQDEVASDKVTKADLEAKLTTAHDDEKKAREALFAKDGELTKAKEAETATGDKVKELQQKLDAAPDPAELAKLKDDLAKAKTDITTADTNIATLKGQLTAAQSGTPADITKLRADLKEANEAKDAAVARANKAEADLKAVPTAAELAKLKEDLTKANEAKGKVESKVTGLEKERDTAKADLVKANARIGVLEGQVKDLQSGVPIDTVKLQADLAKALAAQKTAEDNLAAKQKELDEANKKLATAEETIGELRKEITTLKQQLAAAPKAGDNGNTGATATPGAGQGSASSTDTTKTSKPMAGGNGKTESCMTTEQAQRLIAASVQRIGTEPCSWVIRTFPKEVKVTLPTGFIGTLDLGDGNVVVTEKTGEYTIVAGTFRQRNAFPAWDPANKDNCGLLRKEREFAASETPTFKVSPLGFTCDDGSSRLTPPAGTTPTARLSCPTTPQEAATLVGGKAENWRLLPKTEGLGWKYEGLNITLKVPANSRLDHPAGSATTGEVTTMTATLWCSAGSKK